MNIGIKYKTMLLILLGIPLIAIIMMISACTKTESATVTKTMTSIITVTVTSRPVNSSQIVLQAIIEYIRPRLQEQGLDEQIAEFGYKLMSDGQIHILLDFYGKADDEVVKFVQLVINEISPGLPLDISEYNPLIPH